MTGHICHYVELDGTTSGFCHLREPHGGRCPICAMSASNCDHIADLDAYLDPWCPYPNCTPHHPEKPVTEQPLGGPAEPAPPPAHPAVAALASLPAPATLKRSLAELLQRNYLEATSLRGAVHVPEDTYAIQRQLAGVLELFAEYATAFGQLRKLVADLQQEELVEAVGEQQGRPNQGIMVPDPEGDFRLGPAFANSYTIDLEQLIAVVAIRSPELNALTDQLTGAPLKAADWDVDLAKTAIWLLLGMGKFDPQVSKVRAYADGLSREGRDDLASILKGAIQKTRDYKGVKFERIWQ